MMSTAAGNEDTVQTRSLQQAQAELQVTGDFVHPRINRPSSWTKLKMSSVVSTVPMSRADVCESLMKWPQASFCTSVDGWRHYFKFPSMAMKIL